MLIYRGFILKPKKNKGLSKNRTRGFYNTVKWGSIKNSHLTLNSHTFHGNSLNSVYNSYVTRCLGLRLVTEGFCCPTPKFLKYIHDLWPSIFNLTSISKWKTFMLKDEALIESCFVPTCPRTCKNICLICQC